MGRYALHIKAVFQEISTVSAAAFSVIWKASVVLPDPVALRGRYPLSLSVHICASAPLMSVHSLCLP